MKPIAQWEQSAETKEWLRYNEDKIAVGIIAKKNLSYSAKFWDKKTEQLILNYFISLKSAKTWVDENLYEQGYKTND